MSQRFPSHGITPRAAETMDAICEYGSSKEAARKLDLALKTVDYYRSMVKNAMGARTALAACLMWGRWRRESKR